MKAMILAAGKGERMRPLTEHLPKVLLKVHGVPLIGRMLKRLAAAGFSEVVVNVSYCREPLVAYLQQSQFDLTIHISQEDTPLETGGGIFNALPLLGDAPFLVVSGDIVTDYPFASLRSHRLKGLAHCVCVDNPPYHPQGDFYFKDGHLSSEGESLSYANIGVYSPALFADQCPGRFPLAPLIRKAIAKGQVSAEHFKGHWANVGTPADLADVHQLQEYEWLSGAS